MRFGRVASVIILSSLLIACSADIPTALSPEDPSSTDGAEGASNRAERRPEAGTSQPRGKDPKPSTTESGAIGGTGGRPAGKDAPARSADGIDPAIASARVSDATGDTDSSNDPPAYTDIVGAAIDGRGRTVLLSLTMREDVPRRMPDDNTVLSVNTSIDRRGKTYSVYADGDDEGWTAYIVQGGQRRRLKDAFGIGGATTTIEIPWGLIGGAGRFRWSAGTSWTRSTLTSTYYSFDSAPDSSTARYPGS